MICDDLASSQSGKFWKPTFQVLPGPPNIEHLNDMHFELVLVEIDHLTSERDRFHLRPCIHLRVDRPEHRPWQ